jgi:hypothetical protein
MVVGISSIDGDDASGNETTQGMEFADNRWYRIRVRVTPAKLEAWIDDVPKIEVALEGKRLTLRPGEIENRFRSGWRRIRPAPRFAGCACVGSDAHGFPHGQCDAGDDFALCRTCSRHVCSCSRAARFGF